MYSNFFLLAVLAILTECWAACPQNSCNFPPVSEEIVNLGRCVPAYYGSTGISGKYEPLEGPVSWIVGGLSEVPANFPESLILDTKNLVFQYGSYDIFGYHHNSREWISKEFPRLNTPRGLAIAEEYDGNYLNENFFTLKKEAFMYGEEEEDLKNAISTEKKILVK